MNWKRSNKKFSRGKPVDIRLHFVTDMVEEQFSKSQNEFSKDMLADKFTKVMEDSNLEEPWTCYNCVGVTGSSDHQWRKYQAGIQKMDGWLIYDIGEVEQQVACL